MNRTSTLIADAVALAERIGTALRWLSPRLGTDGAGPLSLDHLISRFGGRRVEAPAAAATLARRATV